MSASKRCECGHLEANHYSLNTGVLGGPCHTTVYAIVQMGGNVTRCRCTRFTPVRAAAVQPPEEQRQ